MATRFPALLVLLLSLGCRHGEPADLVLRHGVIYPLAEDSAAAQAVALRDGRVVYVGDDQGVGSYIGRRTTVLDLEGRMVLPAFRDTHLHPRGGIQLGECTLDNLRTPEAVLDSVRRFVVQHPDAPWIRGSGWQLPVFPEANPRKEWLDSIDARRPMYLRAADGHSAWVNSPALRWPGSTARPRIQPTAESNGIPAPGSPPAPSGKARWSWSPEYCLRAPAKRFRRAFFEP